MSEDSNSRVVFLRRKATFVESIGGEGMKLYADTGDRSIGSYWAGNSSQPGTGLTLSEQNILMPIVLNMEASDRDFRKSVAHFFHAIQTKVHPSDKFGNGGTPLEIGLWDNKKPLSEDNLPLNISDYIKWKHVIGHKVVAKTYEEAIGNQLKEYYIFDPSEDIKLVNSSVKVKDKAFKKLFEIENNMAEILKYLTLFQIAPSTIIGKEYSKLRTIVETEPEKFLKHAESPNTDAVYLITRLVNAKIFKMSGPRVLVGASGEVIGSTAAEAVAYIRDPKMSEQVIAFRGLLQEWDKQTKSAYLVIEEQSKDVKNIQTQK